MDLAGSAGGAGPMDWVVILRHDVGPVLAAWLVLVCGLVAYGRRGRARRRPAPPPTGHPWRALGSLLAGGYVVFLMIVVVFYFVLGARDRSLIWQALGQGSLLTFGMVLPAFVLLSWAQARLFRRRNPQGTRTGTLSDSDRATST